MNAEHSFTAQGRQLVVECIVDAIRAPTRHAATSQGNSLRVLQGRAPRPLSHPPPILRYRKTQHPMLRAGGVEYPRPFWCGEWKGSAADVSALVTKRPTTRGIGAPMQLRIRLTGLRESVAVISAADRSALVWCGEGKGSVAVSPSPPNPGMVWQGGSGHGRNPASGTCA